MGALSKSSSMVDSPTVWELPDSRPSPGGSGLRKVENMKTGRESLEAREDREDGYSPSSQRRAAIEFRARKGWRVVRIYGEERRSSSLDSSTVRRTLKQVADNAGDPKANVGITSSPIGFSQHLRDTSERRPVRLLQLLSYVPYGLTGTKWVRLDEQQSGRAIQRDKTCEQDARGTEWTAITDGIAAPTLATTNRRDSVFSDASEKC